MKNLIKLICFSLLGVLWYSDVYSQTGCPDQYGVYNIDLGVIQVYADPWQLTVGETGTVNMSIIAIGCSGLPQGAMLVQVTISDNIDMGSCLLIDDYGIWSTIWVDHQNNSTVIWILNTKGGPLNGVGAWVLKLPFTAVSPIDEGDIVVNLGFNGNLPWSDNNDLNTTLTGHFKVLLLPTPINLGSFSANVKDCSGVEINWTTYSETNVDKIEVQKSYDGKIYETIAAQKSKGNATMKSNYSVLDGAPLKSGKVYYRLKTIDLDGSTSYSRIIPVTVNCDGKSDMTVYPNPTHGPASVQFSGFKAGSTLQVALLNAQGQVLKTITMDPDERNSLDLTDYPGGVYFLKVLDDQNTLRTKIIKVN